jgi:hypothetical protein
MPGTYTSYDIEENYPRSWEPKKKYVINVPAWNDVIHLVSENDLPPEEQLRRKKQRAINIMQSPTPKIVRDIGVIMTVIDDIQDFTTFTGVGARLLERALKIPQIISKGSFTVGAVLNSVNLMNKIPWHNMSLSDLKDIANSRKIEFAKLTKTERKLIIDEMEKEKPGFNTLDAATQEKILKRRYTYERDLDGMSLKARKRNIENLSIKFGPLSKISQDVDKRLLRLFPTHGEMMEIGQVTDNVAGLGISFGPLVGLVEDVVFGVAKGADWKFKSWAITPEEKAALGKPAAWTEYLYYSPGQLITDTGTMLGRTAYAIAAGEDLGVEDFLTATYASAQAYIMMRAKNVKQAGVDIWETTKDWLWNSGPKTSELSKEAMRSLGIDWTKESGFPGIDIPIHATAKEISEAYLEKIPRVFKHYREKLDGTYEGEFLDSCISAISANTCKFLLPEGGTIREKWVPEFTVCTRAADYDLLPPIWTSDEEFTQWHTYVMDNVRYFDQDGPTYELLLNARRFFWPEFTD